MSDEHTLRLLDIRARLKASFSRRSEFEKDCTALDAAIAALGGEPNMRHPKIQALIGASARRSIELSLIESLLFDPEFEMAGSDWDYETALVTKVMALRDKLTLPAPPSKEG